MFPPETAASVYRYSKGIPRLINTLCDNALITAFARKLETVTPEIIDIAAADLRLNVVRSVDSEVAVGVEETLARRASKSLLEFFSYLRKTPAHEMEQER